MPFGYDIPLYFFAPIFKVFRPPVVKRAQAATPDTSQKTAA
jgi:hypothetical protein